MSVLRIGLTGGIGCGKTTVSDLFGEQGVAVIDTDLISHALTGPAGAAMPAIIEAFGPAVVSPQGALDRGEMRRRVFSDPAARQQLEAILHPRIRQEADARCAAAASPYVLLVVPLLIESAGYRDRVERILVVDCDESTQIERVMARSGLTAAEVQAIMATQVSRAERLAVADDVIRNTAGRAALAEQILTLHQHYLRLAGAKSARNG